MERWTWGWGRIHRMLFALRDGGVNLRARRLDAFQGFDQQ